VVSLRKRNLSVYDIQRELAAGQCVCQLDLAHFDTLIWPPCGTKRSRVLTSACGSPGRSGALRRALRGAFRAERRPGLPQARDQNTDIGTPASGSNA
jgi:hypothetical protein